MNDNIWRFAWRLLGKLAGGGLLPGFVVALLSVSAAHAVTYANVSVPFSWVDPATHAKVGYNTAPYKFNGGGGCGTNPPTIDDTLSDNIPIGFNFMYSGVVFANVRIMSNGRLQFNNNTTCGYGTPVTQLPYPNAGLNYTMRIYGNDLDPTAKSEVPAYNTTCLNRGTCFVSYATLGTDPNRSFVVTWRNVPEWTSSGSISGNYNLQVILQENGEFIYQYGANTPGPGNATAQVGWQADTLDYSVPSVGYPANNSAVKFYIPQPVAEYRMEQPSWTGAAQEILDTSGNGRHASRIGAPQTTAAGYLCRGAAIPGNSNNGNIDAIDTGIAVPSTLGGAGTISFWYQPANWAGNGNQDAQLLDATTASPDWFFLVKRKIDNSNVRLRFVIRDSTGTGIDRIAETANLTNSVLSGTGWVHIAVSWNFNNLAAANSDHLRIYVNGVQQTQLAFTTGGTVSGSIGTLYLGDNRSSANGVNSTGNSADGTLDEVRLYNFEGGVALVRRDKDQGGASCLAHYAISHAGTARACDVNTVTVKAHDASHNTLLMPNNTTTVRLSTSTGQGDWTLLSGYGVLNNGTANDGIATYLFNGEFQAVLGLNHPAAGPVNINVTDGQTAEQEDPLLTLTSCYPNDFNACHNYTTTSCSAAAGKLYTRLAGTAFSTDVVALDSGGSVFSDFTGKAVVSLIARATTGGALDAYNCFVPGYAQTLDNAATSFVAGKLAVNATVPSAYRDARIKVVCDSTNCPPSGMTWCSSDNFAIRPQAFTVSSVANADATGVSTSATPVVKAGVGFGLTATAVAGYGGTPLLDATKAAAHAGAVRNGALAGTFDAANTATGVASGAAFTYDDVGYFRLAAAGVYDDTFTSVDQVSDCTNDFSNTLVGAKFGCKFGNTAATSYFGRFIPDHFTTTVAHGCLSGAYTYSGQPFGVAITAYGSGGGITQNFDGTATPVFAKDVTLSVWDGVLGTTSNPGPGTLTPTQPPALALAGAFTAGTANVTSATYTFTAKLTAATAIRVRAKLTDSTSISSSGATEGTTNARSGRLRLSNAFGSEKAALPMAVQAQYWTGQSWLLNSGDNCTIVPATAIALSGALAASTSASPITLAGGKGTLTLAKPTPTGTGSVDVAINLGTTTADASCLGLPRPATTGANRAWLRAQNGNCATSYDRDPAARASFGIYAPETKKTIHVREQF